MSINAQTYTQREIVPVHPGHELSLPVRLSSNLNLQCGSLVREVTAALEAAASWVFGLSPVFVNERTMTKLGPPKPSSPRLCRRPQRRR